MFTKNTVFIVGAGASHSFGYPLGSHLPKKIRDRADELVRFCRNRHSNIPLPDFYVDAVFPNGTNNPGEIVTVWSRLQSDAQLLSERLKNAGKDTIDYYFNHNQSLSELGRILLAAEIAECEFNSLTSSNREDDNKIDGDNWIKQVANHICRDCNSGSDLIKNCVNFVTFNYDLSIERVLYKALDSRGILHNDNFVCRDSYIRDFLSKDRIIHVYGGLDWDQYKFPVWKPFDLEQYNLAYEYSKKIRLIAPDEKSDSNPNLEIAQAMIDNAEVIYILGFGFDQSNCRLLKFEELLGKNRVQKIFVTNFDDVGTIDKYTINAFGLNAEDYIRDMKLNNRHAHSTGTTGVLFEKSEKGVLDALSKDFGIN